MSDESVYEYLTRLARLLPAADRASDPGLQPVQLQALHYLSCCNRYSDRPGAVAEYLGITKGTASQTLRVLEEAGLLSRSTDPDDGRVVRLKLTRAGRRVLESSGSKRIVREALDDFSGEARDNLETSLQELLRGLQRANRGRSFGVCRTCSHFRQRDDGTYQCGLTREALTASETLLICREHESVAAVSSL